jgi:hypothetical protein
MLHSGGAPSDFLCYSTNSGFLRVCWEREYVTDILSKFEGDE